MGAKFCLAHLAVEISGRSFVFLMMGTELARRNSDTMLGEIAAFDSKYGGLKQQKLILSEFWRPEIQNQGIGKAVLLQKALRKTPFLPPPASGGSRSSLARGYVIPLALHLHTAFLCVPMPSLLSLIRTLVIGLRPTLGNLGWSHYKTLNLITSAKTLFPKKGHIHRFWRLGCGYIFWVYTIQPTTV